MEITTRALTVADAVEFAALSERIEADHPTNLALTAEEFCEFLELGGAELDGVFADGRLGAWGGCLPREPSGSGQVFVIWAEADPELAGRGWRSLMGRRALSWARQRHARDAPDRELTAVHRVASDFAQGIRVAGQLGFVAERYRFNMVAELSPDAPAPQVPEDYELVVFDPGDAELLRAAHNSAFQDHPNHTPMEPEVWHGYLIAARHARSELCWWLRSRADGGVASYLFSQEYAVPISGRAGVKEAYIPYLGTLPDHRGRGLATALLRHALHEYRRAGFDTASLEVDAENPTGALGIYERAGFRSTQRFDEFFLRE